jgi:hypothetical protein
MLGVLGDWLGFERTAKESPVVDSAENGNISLPEHRRIALNDPPSAASVQNHGRLSGPSIVGEKSR